MFSYSFFLVTLESQEFENIPDVKVGIHPQYKLIVVRFKWRFFNWKCHVTSNRKMNVILHKVASIDSCWRCCVLQHKMTYETLKFFPLWYIVLRRKWVKSTEKYKVCCTYSEGIPLFSNHQMVNNFFTIMVRLLFSFLLNVVTS
jgi:hypothetical protein